VGLYVGIASKIRQNWGFYPNFTNSKFKQIKYLRHIMRLGSSERHTFNQVVVGSIPARLTNKTTELGYIGLTLCFFMVSKWGRDFKFPDIDEKGGKGE
jgi:hypothetical protein